MSMNLCEKATISLERIVNPIKKPIPIDIYSVKVVKPWLKTLEELGIRAFCLNDTKIMNHLNPMEVNIDTRGILYYLEQAISYLRANGYSTPYRVIKRSRRPYLTNVEYKEKPLMVKVYFPYALVDWRWFNTLSSLNNEIVNVDQICNCLIGFMGERIIF